MQCYYHIFSCNKKQAWRRGLVIPTVQRLRPGLQSEFHVTLGNFVGPCLTMKNTGRAKAGAECRGCCPACVNPCVQCPAQQMQHQLQ